jgi:hypothetical protein
MNFININRKNIMLFTLVIVMALFSVNTLKLQDVNITAIAAQNEEYQN